MPTDVVVREDLRSLVPVLRAAPIERYAARPRRRGGAPRDAPHRERRPGSVGLRRDRARRRARRRPRGAAVARRLGRLARDGSPSTIERDGPTGLRGPILSGSELAVAVGPGLLSYRGLVEQRNGSFRAIELGAADPRRPTVLRAPLPRDARGARLIGRRADRRRVCSTAAPTRASRSAGRRPSVSSAPRSTGGSARGASPSPAARPAARACASPTRSRASATPFCGRASPRTTIRRSPSSRPRSVSSPAASAARSRCGSAASRSTSGSALSSAAPRDDGRRGRRRLRRAPDGGRHPVARCRSPERALARRRRREGGSGRVDAVAAAVRRPREALPLGARGGRAARSARTRDAPGPRRRSPRGARPRGLGPRPRHPRRPPGRPRRARRPRGPGRDAEPSSPRRDGPRDDRRRRRCPRRDRRRRAPLAPRHARRLGHRTRDHARAPARDDGEPRRAPRRGRGVRRLRRGARPLDHQAGVLEPRGPGRIGAGG